MDVPKDWLGSLPEYLVYLAIKKLGFKEGEDFIYYPRGVGLDFYFPLLVLAINVESEQERMDAMRRAQLQSTRIRFVYIQEADALRNAVYYVKRALRGG